MLHEIKLASDAPGLGKAGQVIQLELKPSDVHDPTELPTYLAGYSPFGFRADEASYPILVDNDSDKYRTFSENDAFAPVNVKGSISGAVPEVDPTSTLETYKVVDRFIGAFVPRVTELQRGNNYDPRMAAARRCRKAIQLDREIDVWTLLATSGNWNAAQVLALNAAQKWNGGVDSDPIRDIHSAVEASAQPVTGIFINTKGANTLLRHDRVRDHMRQMLGDGAAPGTLQQVMQGNLDFVIPGLPPFRVVPGKYKPSTTLDFILGASAVLVTQPPGVPTDGEEVATSYTFRRRGPSGVGFEAREFELMTRGPLGGTMIVVAMADKAIMTGNNCGGLITGIYA